MEDWNKEPIQIRRFNWTDHPTFDELIDKVSGIYPENTDTQHITIKWKDDEGDWIDMTTDQEVRDAI
ncbi:PB1 domain-containing protein, partial [Salmonella sp. s51228]|uniref:PB1 domain-containing protein n=1 Tax=Salmonella sp. s51228 TaxID=3159652 RepID=UPI0039800DBA